MQTKSVLAVAEVNRILEAARAEAEKNHWAVAIAVVDDGGHPLGMLRLDGSQYEDMVNGGRSAFLSAPLVTSLAGGVPVLVDGQVVGAVGVSGVKPDQDAQVATAGANSVAA